MNNEKKSFGLFALLSMLVAAVGGVLIFLAFYSDYDLSIRHFERSSPLAIAAGCAVAVGILLSAAAAILLSKKANPPRAEDSSSAAVFVSVFAGCLIIGNVAVNLIFGESSITLLMAISGLFAVLSGVYMILSPLRGASTKPAVQLLCLAPALWLGFTVIKAYQGTETSMNDPFNTYYALALIGLLLYFTSTVGFTLRPESRKGFYVFSAYLLLSVGGAAILSRLILSLVQKSAFNVSVLESIMFLALYVYAAMQVFSLNRRAKKTDEVAPEAVSEEISANETDTASSNEE